MVADGIIPDGGVTFRAFTPDDIDDIAREYYLMWGRAQSTADAGIAALVERYEVLRYLSVTTRGEITVRDGRFMGVTLSCVVGEEPILPNAHNEMHAIEAELNTGVSGADALRESQRWNGLRRQLERDSGAREGAQAELQLFLVVAAARGHGVGMALWRRLMRHFAAQGVRRYYLHTDSSSDVGFYKHQGLRCAASRFAADHEEAGARPVDDLFIYSGDVNHGEI